MLFAFRGMRFFQALLALIALVTALAAVVIAKVVADGASAALLIPAAVLALVFVWMFGATLRVPTSYLAVAEERTRIRLGGFVDTVVANSDIVSMRLARWPLWGGLGVRTNFRGRVGLVTAVGEAVEIQLRRPVRVWVIPRLLPVRATTLVLTLRNGGKLVERWQEGGTRPSPASAPDRKMRRRGR